MIKILTACATGMNSSQQIKNGIETELKSRGYEVSCDTAVLSTITKDMLQKYDIFAPIQKQSFGFECPIPTVVAGPLLYRMPQFSEPVYKELIEVIEGLPHK